MKFSFIIPTLNEEKNISRIIRQFDALKDKLDFEIIVSDGGSNDRTIDIAKSLGARIIKNERKTQNIAKNRNSGARAAKGEILIFFDADTLVKNPAHFIERVTEVFRDKNIIAGMPRIAVFPKERIWKDKVYHSFYNNALKLSFIIKNPASSGQCQIVRKSAFNKINGYNEKLIHAEDTELFRRLIKLGKLHYFSDLLVYESPRRYRKLGYLKLILVGTSNTVSQVVFKKNMLKEWKRVG